MERSRNPHESKRLPMLALAGGTLFIAGAASLGLGMFQHLKDLEEIKDRQYNITQNINLTEEERAELLSEIPKIDRDNPYILAIDSGWLSSLVGAGLIVLKIHKTNQRIQNKQH